MILNCLIEEIHSSMRCTKKDMHKKNRTGLLPSDEHAVRNIQAKKKASVLSRVWTFSNFKYVGTWIWAEHQNLLEKIEANEIA